MIPSAETLRRAGEILQEVDKLRNELIGLFGEGGGGSAPIATPAPVAPRRGRPPGPRAPAASPGPGPKKRNMSPEARARIAAAARARWARYRVDKKSGK